MGGHPTEIVKAESFHQQSLADSSLSILNVQGASSAGGGLLVVVVLVLA